ncbi:MAG: hypothetical protein MZW92_19130 [Comamonadaceae bacterium]|nr:hypothetical protein [Comamonadaceae bacterium]
MAPPEGEAAPRRRRGRRSAGPLDTSPPRAGAGRQRPAAGADEPSRCLARPDSRVAERRTGRHG